MQRLAYKWKVVALLFGIAALNYADRTAVSAVFPLIRAELHLSDIELAAIGSLFLWTYAVCSPFAGWLADRISRRSIVIWSLSCWSLVMIASGLATTSWQLLASRVLLGAAECAYVPAAIALIAGYHTSETRGKAISFHNAGLSFGLVAGASLSGLLSDHFGWRVSFFLLGGGGLFFAAISQLFLRDSPETLARTAADREPLWTGIVQVIRIRTFLVILGEGILVAAGLWMFANWLPLYFRETYGMSLAAAGFSATFLPKLSAVLGSTTGGALSDRLGARRPERRLLLQSCWYLASTPILIVFFRPAGSLVLVGCISLFYLMRSLGSTNETPILCDIIPAHRRSTAIGLFNTSQTMAGGIGIMVAGALKKDFGLAGVFGGISGLMMAASLLSFFGYRFLIRKDLPSHKKVTV